MMITNSSSSSRVDGPSVMSSDRTAGLPAEVMILQAQIMLSKDFDDQIQDTVDKIDYLNDVKKKYRSQINSVNRFLAASQNTSRKDGRRYHEASAKQMADLMKNLKRHAYNTEDLSPVTEKSLFISDTGKDHEFKELPVQNGIGVDVETGLPVVTIKNDKSETKDWQKVFEHIADSPDAAEARQRAEKIGDDDGSLPFYMGHQNNQFDDGQPKFAVFTESLDHYMEIMRSELSDLDIAIEKLNLTLNRLVSQRREALEGASETLRTIEEVNTRATNAIG